MTTHFDLLLQQWHKAFNLFAEQSVCGDGPLRLSYTLRPGKAPFSHRDDVICLNAYPLLTVLDTGAINRFVGDLLDLIGTGRTLEFVEPHWLVLEDMAPALNAGHHLDNDLLNGLILFGWCIQQHVARKLLVWKKYRAGSRTACFERQGLYVRPGIVELRALYSFLMDPDETLAQLDAVMAVQADEAALYAPPGVPMWNTDDIGFNLRRLMTHAGFYTDTAQARDSFSTWCRGYFDALAAGTILHHNKAFWYSLGVLAVIHQRTGTLPAHASPPPTQRFYQSLAGRRVLFVTPFADSVNQLVVSGALWHLYHDIELPVFELEAIPAFISTYPNRPHTDYRETLDRLVHAIDTRISGSGIDFFLASCGCYGLPLCHHVYRQWGITCVYMGNSTNTLFGILQNTSLDFMRSHRIEANWLRGNLGQYKNLERIDQGRYL